MKCSLKYCPGDDTAYDCPKPAEHVRSTFPEHYYPPVSWSSGVSSDGGDGWKSIDQCYALTWMTSTRGRLYEYVWYNPDTDEYDRTRQYAWAGVVPGYYLTTRFRCAPYAYYSDVRVCPAGSYCPGKSETLCTNATAEIVYTPTFGLEPCPAGTYSGAGASECVPCTNAPENAVYTSGSDADNCPWKCDDGYAKNADAKCAPLCTAGVTRIRTPDLSIPLFASPQTAPSINVRAPGGVVCYGALVTGVGGLNIKIGDTIYHAVE